MDNTPRVTEILKDAGLIDMSCVPLNILERAMAFGTAVHKATELWDKGTLDISTLSKPLVPYLDAWIKFVLDYKLKFKAEDIEKTFISTKWGFHGTPDRIVKDILVDIKTGSTLMPVTALQTAAYSILAEENGIKIKRRLAVQLTEKGYKITEYKSVSDKTVFLSALNLYKFKNLI